MKTQGQRKDVVFLSGVRTGFGRFGGTLKRHSATQLGAIAIGHPLAATGSRITVHLLHALRRARHRYGLGAACIGGGQGIALIVEAF